MIKNIGIALVGALLLNGCASRQAVEQQANQYPDPIEPFNRAMWDFNFDILDKYLLKPVTLTYIDYMPQAARTGLLNAANNLDEPANALNNLLQGKVEGTLVSIGRFTLNSTVGLVGMIDVAGKIGLDERQEEFGEVLGKWGVSTGPYLMRPAVGPSDIRSSVGDAVDNSYFPLDALNIYGNVLRVGVRALEGRASVLQQEQQLATSSDPYTFVKSAYFQNLEFRVKDGKVEKSEQEKELDAELDAFLDDL